MKDEMADDLAAFGASVEIMEAVKDQSRSDDFEVFEDNWQAVMFFMRLQTQWVATMGGVVGLSYPAVEVMFRIEGIENQRELFADLQVMEFAALQVMNTKD